MRTAYALAVVALVGSVVAAVHGCSSQDCCGSCPGDQVATFLLSCTTANLTSVEITGPCEQDAGLSVTRSVDAAWVGNVFVQGQSPGVCHVRLTFATGFTYSTDVTFSSQSGGVCGGPQCKCGDILAPTVGTFTVNNPSDTCVVADSGADVSVETTLYGPCDGGCGADAACAYPVDGGCSAAGVCLPLTGAPPTCRVPTYCTCNGMGVGGPCDFPPGYVPAPVVGPYGDGACQVAAGDAGDASPDGGQAAACTDRSTCASGEICCLLSALTSSAACRTGPCPTVPGLGLPIQLCSSAAECFTSGDTCAPFVAGAAGKVCSAPKDASGE